MLKTINPTEVRDRLGEILDRAAAGDVLAITRYGRPKAVLVGASQYLALVEELQALRNGKTLVAEPAGPNSLTIDQFKEMLR